jgi:hypothetical protein
VKINHVFLKPVHHYAYRRPNCDIPLITGLVHVELNEDKDRLCYEVTYEDGFKDYVPTSEIIEGNYKFVIQ